MSPLVALLLTGSTSPAQAFLDQLRYAMGSGSEAKVAACFARRDDAQYLFAMAGRRGGLRSVKVAVVPAPPGWSASPYWVVFHTFQDIEADHDAVYQMVRTMDSFQIGREILEKDAVSGRVVDAAIQATIEPKSSRVTVDCQLHSDGLKVAKAPVYRLNDVYSVTKAALDGKTATVVTATDQTVPDVKEGQVLRAGGLLIPWVRQSAKDSAFSYTGVVNQPNEDKITSNRCYLTAWWVPSTARLPFTTKVQITAPAAWVVRSEGIVDEEAVNQTTGDNRTVSYRCDVPISYPKIIGGQYHVAASLTDRGRLFRAYQLDPVNTDRGKKTVELAAKAVAWQEDHLTPFPFPGYDTFEASGYYGIESYSHTLLTTMIVNDVVSHEIGHTYFGGLAPCAYVQDSWNEGVTQYVDSVLYGGDADETLEGGLRSIDQKMALSAMAAPHDADEDTYWRGAYVMRMLEHEIGLPAIWTGLKNLVTDRRGKDTTWLDLQGVFEKASGQKLDWFWKQWVTAETFPTLKLASWTTETWDGKRQVRATVQQSGSPTPYRLRYRIRCSRGLQTKVEEVTMTSPEATTNVAVDFDPEKVELDVLGYSLVAVTK